MGAGGSIGGTYNISGTSGHLFARAFFSAARLGRDVRTTAVVPQWKPQGHLGPPRATRMARLHMKCPPSASSSAFPLRPARRCRTVQSHCHGPVRETKPTSWPCLRAEGTIDKCSLQSSQISDERIERSLRSVGHE